MRKIVVVLGLVVGVSAQAQTYKPDFDCSKVNQDDSIAVMLCQNSDAAKAELIMDQAYYALRQKVGRSGWKQLKAEINADMDFQHCLRPDIPVGDHSIPSADPECYISDIDKITEKYRRRLSGDAQGIGPAVPVPDHS
ncbi:hypothetical protein [Acetobacter sp.]|uniref:hypothetical protein n=1 Tax=Acetobacter sp. TaxID=440 RepID=UPI0025B83364|nr:hypothetical protein [Acetobacter sp.]MCH4090725.1 hypothetical protein [Acetobacter sp.]MCI1300559.1 hypothetical protein [Acetobacter sp.]MCI1316239.1 hypothetical protein [Acetobacter sp.]